MGGETGLPKIGQVRSMPARLLEIPVTSILLALLVSTHAHAASHLARSPVVIQSAQRTTTPMPPETSPVP